MSSRAISESRIGSVEDPYIHNMIICRQKLDQVRKCKETVPRLVDTVAILVNPQLPLWRPLRLAWDEISCESNFLRADIFDDMALDQWDRPTRSIATKANVDHPPRSIFQSYDVDDMDPIISVSFVNPTKHVNISYQPMYGP